jgi:hypothetical protein
MLLSDAYHIGQTGLIDHVIARDYFGISACWRDQSKRSVVVLMLSEKLLIPKITYAPVMASVLLRNIGRSVAAAII